MNGRPALRASATIHRDRPGSPRVLLVWAASLAACLPGCGERSGGAGTTQPTGQAVTKPAASGPTSSQVAAARDRPAASGPAASAPASVPAGMVVLDLGLAPDAVTRATPGYTKGIKPPHLRAEVKRKPFLVPEGVENLALYKDVSSSESQVVLGDLDQLTDGIKKSGEFEYVEFGTARPWVQIDLGAPRDIHAIAIWHFYKNATIYNDVIVRIADDEACTRNVRTLFNNDHDNSAGLGRGKDTAFYTRWWAELVDARDGSGRPARARYVRVYTATGMEGESVRFVEIDVYGQ